MYEEPFVITLGVPFVPTCKPRYALFNNISFVLPEQKQPCCGPIFIQKNGLSTDPICPNTHIFDSLSVNQQT